MDEAHCSTFLLDVSTPKYPGTYVLIDWADAPRVCQRKWSQDKHYPVAKVDGKVTLLHRYLLDAPPGIWVDHFNLDKTDFRRQNLRLVSPRQNSLNRPGLARSSKYKGVTWMAEKNKWRVWVGRKFHGYFVDEKEAAMHADLMALDLYGDHAFLNFEPVSEKVLQLY